MSLTSFLNKTDVKKKFQQTFPKLEVNINKELLAPPVTNHYSLVGTSFDYLMRFYLMHLNPDAITQKWVAEEAVELISSWRWGFGYDSNDIVEVDRAIDELVNAKFNDSLDVSDEQKMKLLDIMGKYGQDFDDKWDNIKLTIKGLKIIKMAKLALSEYMKSGTISEPLLKSAIMLAQLDYIYRSGTIDENLGIVDMGDMIDLIKLITIINPESFKAREICVLNPTFGKASKLVGGADVDLVIDDMLIDIKTTQNPYLKEDYFHQIIGYYTLYKIGGIDGMSSKHKIKRLGIYSSRYAYLHVIKVQDVIDKKTYPKFLKWFKDRANDKSQNNKLTKENSMHP